MRVSLTAGAEPDLGLAVAGPGEARGVVVAGAVMAPVEDMAPEVAGAEQVRALVVRMDLEAVDRVRAVGMDLVEDMAPEGAEAEQALGVEAVTAPAVEV
jgi:hypothetical protein